MQKITVALVGLSFGLEFVPIYQDHPDVADVLVVDLNPQLLKTARERYSIPEDHCFTDVQAVLDNPGVDCVHLVTPPSTHAQLSIRVLNAGKHCGCTIPMGMSINELFAVIDARRRAGKNYMFLETTIFQRETLYVKERIARGDFGRVQYMSCAHYQDMEGWPAYWDGFPPLMHPTHAVAPCLMLADRLPTRVYGRGSGKIRPELTRQYGCPYAFETALLTLEDSDITIEMERFLYGVARGYSECFRVYGEDKSFEWQQMDGEGPVLFQRTDDFMWGGRTAAIAQERITVPDYAHLLPAEIGKYTTSTVYNAKDYHLSFTQGGGHGGSHPHMVQEFVRPIVEQRAPYPDDIVCAYWT
ncbi:MAG: Gfo/Idh/MocA family oxidoreductase, partial [Eubacteriales bacterium]|nr:Gfo/Idh/MocA family oxidoreductase [Eubacteriales bacterium]